MGGGDLTPRNIRHVAVGEMIVSTAHDEVLYTCVGSCVAVALYDDTNKIMGMLHIVLPGRRGEPRVGDRSAFYADTGIPLLIAEMEHHGAILAQITATVVGGACLTADGKHTIGLDNTAQALSLLAKAVIPVTREETGGDCGRTIRIWVENGELQIQEAHSAKMTPVAANSEKPLTQSFLKNLSHDLAQLRPNPQVAKKLFDAIHERTINWSYVEKILYQDFVLALHVLQMCNSEYYGIPSEIDSFETALSLLGPDRFRRICVVAAAEKHNESLLSEKGIDQTILSRHCLASAIAARHIATKSYSDIQTQIFAAAFFHPIGSIAAQLADRKINTGLDKYNLDDCLCLVKNDSEIARQHAHLARALLTQWHTPPIIIETISPLKLPPIEQDKLSLDTIVTISCIISAMLGILVSKEKIIDVECSVCALELMELAFVNDQLLAEIIMKLRTKGIVP
jgi:chemotaxis protein CheD